MDNFKFINPCFSATLKYMVLLKSHSKKLIFSTLISLGAALLFITKPIFAQTPLPTTSTGQEQIGEQDNANDFDDDVKQGKDELQKDPEAQRHQNEVVDGEDGTAGEGDGQNNQEDVDEFDDIQDAENNQGVNEDNQDINNSGIDEVGDTNNLNEQSQEIINEHQIQEAGEINNEQQNQETSPESGTPTSNQEENSSPEQNQ